jgi:hypothetical protein
MAEKQKQKVVLVQYHPGKPQNLTVIVDGQEVPIGQYLETHTAVQVSALTQAETSTTNVYLALMIATEDKKKGAQSW